MDILQIDMIILFILMIIINYKLDKIISKQKKDKKE